VAHQKSSAVFICFATSIPATIASAPALPRPFRDSGSFAFCSSMPIWVSRCAKLISFRLWGMAASSLFPVLSENNPSLEGVTMSYVWYEYYEAVVLETDWTKMHERIQSAECKIHDRQRVLSEDHGGTPQERQAIANALNGMRTLQAEVADWQSRQALRASETSAKASIPEQGMRPNAI
jgi:hypothetical protein